MDGDFAARHGASVERSWQPRAPPPALDALLAFAVLFLQFGKSVLNTLNTKIVLLDEKIMHALLVRSPELQRIILCDRHLLENIKNILPRQGTMLIPFGSHKDFFQ